MDKFGKTKEMGVVGAVLTCIVFIIMGFILVTNNTSTDELGKQSIDLIGYGFLFMGILVVLLLIVVGLIWLLKELDIGQ